jgi:hypothetical protein
VSIALTVRRTYLVFASYAVGGFYRQLTKSPSMKDGEGVMLADDDKPHRGKTVTEAAWAELTALLASSAPEDVTTAIQELDERSGGRRSGLTEYARKPVLDLLRPMIATTTGPLQGEVIAVFGTNSPYTRDRDVPWWLAGTGKGLVSGLTPRPAVKNTDADVAVRELTAIADDKLPAERRALAIRALGRSTPQHAAAIARWINDPEPLVRCAAVLLAADVPDAKLITAAAADPSNIVRRGAAHAMGFAQLPALLPTLGLLLRDPALEVRTAAALSLLSFSVDDAGPVLKQSLSSDYRPLFINALARKDPALYLSELAEVIEKDLRAVDFWGGSIPSGDSWRTLFDYVKKQPAADLAQKKLDRSLDALEKLHWFGSSEPQSLYALYVVRGLHARAKSFRAAVKKSAPFDMSSYFDRVDKNPATYGP